MLRGAVPANFLSLLRKDFRARIGYTSINLTSLIPLVNRILPKMSDSKIVLGLDIGSNSIGWALARDGSAEVISPLMMGVRVFPEGVDRDQTGGEVSRNEARRIARGMRRQTVRRARRKKRIRIALIHAGLFPADPDLQKKLLESTDPYTLRERALREPLTPHEFGRVLIHLNQRRGFLSNRKSDGGKKETSETLEKISALASEMGDQTLGQFLSGIHAEPNERLRGRHTRRDMFLTEFERIWEFQKQYHPDLLTDTLKYGNHPAQKYPVEPIGHSKETTLLDEFGIHGLIFFQRPIYWPASVIGRCELELGEKRAPRADRRFQYFRILNEVNNIRIIGPRGDQRLLTDIQRSKLIQMLLTSEDCKFEKIRKELSILEDEMFNLERGDRKKLDGHKTDHHLSKKNLYHKDWAKLPEALKNSIVQSLIHDEEEAILARATAEWGCSPERAEALSRTFLPEGYASFSILAMEKLIPFLEKGLRLMANDSTDSALHAAGYIRADQKVVNPRSSLPDIPESITNPLVRQALREVRKVIHGVIREHGMPDAIHIELAREVHGGAEQRAKTTKKMRENENRRDSARESIKALGYKGNREDVTRYQLWRDQKEICFYSGRPISTVQLFGGEVDIDHILPYPRSLDDSQSNKVVCFRDQNQDKADRTPYEWLADSNPKKYDSILQRTVNLPPHARMAKLERVARKQLELSEFINRQLTDTAYITKLVHGYIQQLGIDVVCVKGQHTAELRHLWGINELLRDDGLNLKNREDHRHHAVDALVIAMTNRRTLQGLSRYWKSRSEFARDNHRRSTLAPPSDSFRDDVQALVDQIVVSHKPRRRITGALHEETLYGPTDKPEKGKPGPRGHAKNWKEEPGTFVLRKGLTSLTLAEVAKIRDEQVRLLVIKRLREHGIDPDSKSKIPPTVWAQPLLMVGKKGLEKSPNAPVIKTVRILKNDQTIRPIRGGSAWVKPGNTHHICLFEIPGKKGKEPTRDMVGVPMIDAIARAQAGESVISRTHPTNPDARFLFSLSAGEMVEGTIGGMDSVFVYKTSASTSKQIWFATHLDARKSAQQKTYSAMPNTLKVEKILVDPLGQIRRASD
jgi:CRISPR-associated endonuclease Csn1